VESPVHLEGAMNTNFQKMREHPRNCYKVVINDKTIEDHSESLRKRFGPKKNIADLRRQLLFIK
jgi:hypothetical protein